MSKILKNSTGSSVDITDVGQTIAASSNFTINAQEYDLYATSNDVVELIGDGTLIVNDGSFDLDKADGIRLIQGGFTNKIVLEDDLLNAQDRIKVDVTGTLEDGRVKVSSNDSTTGFLADKITSANNKIAITAVNDGSDEDVQIQIQPANIGTSELNNDANFINSAGAPVQPSDIADFETTTQLDARDVANRNRSNHTGTQTASTISDFNSAVVSAETTTSLAFNNTTKVLSYTNEDGSTTNVDLTQFLDDTNLARITTGTLNSSTGIATFTRDDNSTFTVDFSSLNDQSAINTAISTHEQSINNHDDVDTSTNTPSTGDTLTYDGTNWTPQSNYKVFARTTSGEVNQLNTFEQYLRLSATIPTTGTYKISWHYQWSINTTGNDFIARLQLNDSTDIMTHQQESKDSAGTGVTLPNTEGGNSNTSTNQRFNESGFDIVTLNAGSNTLDLDWRGEVFDIEPAIYKAIISIEKW
jgi:hypothetical protein